MPRVRVAWLRRTLEASNRIFVAWAWACPRPRPRNIIRALRNLIFSLLPLSFLLLYFFYIYCCPYFLLH